MRPGPAALLACRFFLSAVFLYAGFVKAHHPAEFAAQVAAYRLLPSELVTLVALALPRLELLAGGFLLIGFLSESSALVLGTLSLGFAVGVASAVLRGLDIECGCFSGSGSAVGWPHVALDLLLAGLALAVLLKGPGPWSVDLALQEGAPSQAALPAPPRAPSQVEAPLAEAVSGAPAAPPRVPSQVEAPLADAVSGAPAAPPRVPSQVEAPLAEAVSGAPAVPPRAPSRAGASSADAEEPSANRNSSR